MNNLTDFAVELKFLGIKEKYTEVKVGDRVSININNRKHIYK